MAGGVPLKRIVLLKGGNGSSQVNKFIIYHSAVSAQATNFDCAWLANCKTKRNVQVANQRVDPCVMHRMLQVSVREGLRNLFATVFSLFATVFSIQVPNNGAARRLSLTH